MVISVSGNASYGIVCSVATEVDILNPGGMTMRYANNTIHPWLADILLSE